MIAKGQSPGGKAAVEKLPNGNYQVEIEQGRFEVQPSEAEDLLWALTSALRPFAGYSIADRIQQNLDVVIDRLQAGEEAEDGRDPGRAEGYTMVLAIVRNPYAPDYPGERKQQMSRWRKRNS